MARGIVFGQVTKSGKPLAGASAALSSIRGADANGILVQYNVPREKQEIGSWPYKNTILTEQRITNADGVFVIPFSWDQYSADNLARVAGVDVLNIKVTVFDSDTSYKTFWGPGYKVPDIVQLINNIKTGMLLQSGSNKEILDKLKPEFKNAITGKEFNGIPFTMLSTDQTAILGLLPNLAF